MLCQSSSEKLITADFPPGCKGGPGVSKDSDIKVIDGVCVYSTLENDEKVAAVLLHSNQPSTYGDMLVSFGLVRDNNTVKRVYQYTEGWAHMQFEYEGVRVRFNPAPGKKLKDNATRRKDGSLYLPNLGLVTYVEVALPDHQRIISDWYMVEGEAQGRESPTGSDMFHQFEKEVQGVQNSTLNFVVTMWQMEMVHGWYFNHHIFIYLKYFAEGKWKSFSKGLWMVEGSMLEPHMMNNGSL